MSVPAPLTNQIIQQAIQDAKTGIEALLDQLHAAGEVKQPAYHDARRNAPANIAAWLNDPHIDRLSPRAKEGIVSEINAARAQPARWQRLLNAFARDVKFGTGGIREKMGFEREDLLALKQGGILAPILRGPNMINDLVLLLKSAGMASYARAHGFRACVIGHDSRIGGGQFARRLAQLFLARGLRVFIFDEPNMYPEVCYAVPRLKAQFGIFISASHNDLRYNGYKVSSGNGSQFNQAARNEIYNDHMARATFADIQLIELHAARPGELVWLGGNPTQQSINFPDQQLHDLPRGKPLPHVDYAGHQDCIVDLHTLHIEHCKQFLRQPELIRTLGASSRGLKIAYCAYHGAGRKAVPRLLEETGFGSPVRVQALDALDGMFPAFCSDPGQEQQPDPGDARAADIAVHELQRQQTPISQFDMLIGTDPDSDRCGITLPLPPEQIAAYATRLGDGKRRDYLLLPADEAWALLLHYQLSCDARAAGGKLPEAHRKFIVLSHVTSDVITRVARHFGLGVIKTWVGFAMLARAVDMMWNRESLPDLHEGRTQPNDTACHNVLYETIGMHPDRTINIGAYEQSNGFSCLGGPPADALSMGSAGHVRDKDGALAALLLAEVAAAAKAQAKSLLDLADAIYALPDVGLFANYYEPDPLDGEYPGLRGDAHKANLLLHAERLLADVQAGQPLALASMPVTGAVKYLAGKYQAPTNWDGFPDEGLRFYFGTQGEPRLSHLTIRPSGTSNAMRFHVQLHAPTPQGGWAAGELTRRKADLYQQARDIVAEFRRLIGADASA